MSIWISFRQRSSEKILSTSLEPLKKLFILSFWSIYFQCFSKLHFVPYIGLVDTFIENVVEVDRLVFTVLFFVKQIF